MPRYAVPLEQRVKEGKVLLAKLTLRQQRESGFTRQKLLSELGVDKALFSRWLKGSSAIPDRRLLQLSQRLGFDPVQVRPSLGDLYLAFPEIEYAVRINMIDSDVRGVIKRIIQVYSDDKLT